MHPESYSVAKALLKHFDMTPQDAVGGKLMPLCEQTGYQQLADALSTGAPTLRDIVKEISKPGRDPRDELPPPLLRSDVLEMKDLKPGMILKGTVRNVIDFGAFVDIGVHQDGLVHISEMASKHVDTPSQVCAVGDTVQVKVMEIDLDRRRISLSMKSAAEDLNIEVVVNSLDAPEDDGE